MQLMSSPKIAPDPELSVAFEDVWVTKEKVEEYKYGETKLMALREAVNLL